MLAALSQRERSGQAVLHHLPVDLCNWGTCCMGFGPGLAKHLFWLGLGTAG